MFGGFSAEWRIGNFATPTPTLVDLSAFAPPVPVVANLQVVNATASAMSFGSLDVVDGTNTGSDERIGLVRLTVNAGWNESSVPHSLTAYQAMMLTVSAGTAAVYMSSFEW